MTRYAHVILMLCVYSRTGATTVAPSTPVAQIALIFNASLSFLPFLVIPCRRDKMHLCCPDLCFDILMKQRF